MPVGGVEVHRVRDIARRKRDAVLLGRDEVLLLFTFVLLLGRSVGGALRRRVFDPFLLDMNC
jgi:hypothetical protein